MSPSQTRNSDETPSLSNSSDKEALQLATRAFEEGDYATARAHAQRAKADENPELASQAEELLTRMSPAPLTKYLLLLTGLLLAAVTAFAYIR